MQLSLPFTDGVRYELPASRGTWRDASGAVRVLVQYPHCFDDGWPWFCPDDRFPAAAPLLTPEVEHATR